MAHEGRGEPFVERGEQDQHHRRSGVDEPVRHGPVDLDAAGRLQLVRLAIAIVVELLVRADDEVGGRGRDEGRRSAGDVARLVEAASDLGAKPLVGHDHDALALAEPSARRAPDRQCDPLEDLAVDWVREEAPVHPPPCQDVAKLHPQALVHFLKRNEPTAVIAGVPRGGFARWSITSCV